MTMKRNNGGFTLLELVITIAIGSMITIAASTTLLLGLRINAVSTSTVTQQNTTNMLVYVLENIAEKDDVKLEKVEKEGSENEYVWYIMGNGQDHTTAYIKVDSGTLYLNGTSFMEDIEEFDAGFSTDNRLLTIEITTNSTPKTSSTTYTASIYCRLNDPPQEGD